MSLAAYRPTLLAGAILCVMLLPGPASAQDTADAQTSKEIRQTMQNFMAAWARQANPRELSELLYDTSGEFALVGEGLKHPVEDVSKLLGEFETLRKEWRAGCTFTLRGPLHRSGSLAATLNVLGCPASGDISAFNYYVLLVWKQTDRGWRVVMESYSTVASHD